MDDADVYARIARLERLAHWEDLERRIARLERLIAWATSVAGIAIAIGIGAAVGAYAQGEILISAVGLVGNLGGPCRYRADDNSFAAEANSAGRLRSCRGSRASSRNLFIAK